MHSGWIPGYPIVVVKENERIKTGTPTSKSEASLRSSSGFQFAFVHDVFDNTKSRKQLSSNNETPVTKGRGTSYGYPYHSEAAARARQAYDMYDAAGIDGWQRDWVYYGISPTNTTGKYNRRYVEKVVGFQMLGNASNALNKISDQPACDPVANGNWNVKHIGNGRYLPSCWTDGEFELLFKVYVGTNSPVGTELKVPHRVLPQSLFKITTEKNYAQNKKNYKIKTVEAVYCSMDQILLEWDLKHFSSMLKVVIEEKDLGQTSTRSDTQSSEYAVNFGLEIGTGVAIKTGLKFGASGKWTSSSTYSETITSGNDELGEVILRFEDRIITSKKQIYRTSSTGSSNDNPDCNERYKTTWCQVWFAPGIIEE